MFNAATSDHYLEFHIIAGWWKTYSLILLATCKTQLPVRYPVADSYPPFRIQGTQRVICFMPTSMISRLRAQMREEIPSQDNDSMRTSSLIVLMGEDRIKRFHTAVLMRHHLWETSAEQAITVRRVPDV